MAQDDTQVHRNVLVIDDRHADLTIIYEHLKDHYTVSTVNSVDSALAILDSGTPVHFVLTDLIMGPDHPKDGVDFIRIMKTRDSPVAIVAMSGEATPEVSALAVREGAVHFVDKARLKAPQGYLSVTLAEIEEQVDRYHRLQRGQRELLEQAMMDQTTGLYNRAQFNKDLWQEVSRHTRRIHNHEPSDLSLLMIDVNDMKKANDELGHPYVDKFILNLLGKAIHRSFQRTYLDQGYRFGGDELAVILKETDAEGALVVAERIVEKWEEMRRKTTYTEYVAIGGTATEDVFTRASTAYGTVSVGVAEAPKVIEEDEKRIKPESVVSLADMAVYNAKAEAKKTVPAQSRIVVYTPGMRYPAKDPHRR